jgi:hypothetical protein
MLILQYLILEEVPGPKYHMEYGSNSQLFRRYGYCNVYHVPTSQVNSSTWLASSAVRLYSHTFRYTIKRVTGDIRRCIKTFRDWVTTKYMLTFGITRWEATQRVMAAKLTRLTHKIAIQLHLVAENCTICISRSRWPARKLGYTVV